MLSDVYCNSGAGPGHHSMFGPPKILSLVAKHGIWEIGHSALFFLEMVVLFSLAKIQKEYITNPAYSIIFKFFFLIYFNMDCLPLLFTYHLYSI